MRQVQIDEFGGPEVLHLVEVPDQLPGPGQVAIAVDAAGITFVETQVRADRFRPPTLTDVTLPLVLGNGVEGTIVAVGDGIDPGRVGEHVVTATGGTGGYVDRVVVQADAPLPLPGGLERGQAVALLADGRTALAQIRAGAPEPGERVMILAAAGGVGSLLVQLAKAAGAHVVAAAGGAAKASVATDLGADETIDYLEPGWTDTILAAGPVDVVFDGVGGQLGSDATRLLADGGRRVAFGMASGSWATNPTARSITDVRGAPVDPEDNRALVARALHLAATGELRVLVGQVFALTDAADAHRAIEARTTVGKTILVPSPTGGTPS